MNGHLNERHTTSAPAVADGTSNGRRRSTGRVFSLAAAVVTLAGAILLAAAPSLTTAAMDTTIRRVRVAEVESGGLERAITFSSFTRAVDRARIAFTIGGRLAERPVEVGDRVTTGAVLARLDDRELVNAVAVATASVQQLEVNRAQLERDAGRVAELVTSKAATTEELEQTRSSLQAIEAAEAAARAHQREAERLLGEARLTAPFSGTVAEVGAEPGENVRSGAMVATLIGDGPLEVEIEVPESFAFRVEEGDTVRVSFPTSGLPAIEGTISSLSTNAPGPGRLFPIVVELPAGDRLVAGLTAKVTLRLRETDVLLVPVTAVVDPGGHQPSVFCVRDGIAYRIVVEVAGLQGDRVAVTGDLGVGDRVVIGGQRGLLDSDEVEVVP